MNEVEQSLEVLKKELEQFAKHYTPEEVDLNASIITMFNVVLAGNLLAQTNHQAALDIQKTFVQALVFLTGAVERRCMSAKKMGEMISNE